MFRDYSTFMAVASAKQGRNGDKVIEPFTEILHKICQN